MLVSVCFHNLVTYAQRLQDKHVHAIQLSERCLFLIFFRLQQVCTGGAWLGSCTGLAVCGQVPGHVDTPRHHELPQWLRNVQASPEKPHTV
jgi:hypothetical protein